MSEEKHNSSESWRLALGELSSLPGEDLYDVNKGWRNLGIRLYSKKKKSKKIWYWTAAACISICAGGAWLNTNEKTAIQNTAKAEKRINSTDALQPIPAIIPAIPLKFISLKREHAVSATTRRPLYTPVPVISITIPAIELNSIISVINDSPVVKSKPIFFTALKKKILVVHINDLETPTTRVEEVVGNNDHPLRIRVFNSTISQPFPSGNDAGDILKIKIFPQN